MNRRMRQTLCVLSFILIAGQGCSPAVATDRAAEPPAQALLPATDIPPTQESLATPTAELVVPPTAVDTIPVPSNTPVSGPIVEGNRIQFPPGGTWVEVSGSLVEGASITYVLAAMQGQIMSVSVRQSWPFSVEVQAGTQLLSDPQHERPFWRGELPTTQDYAITLHSQGTGAYTLRVAINPPAKALQFFDYTDPQHSASLRYSDEFAPTDYIPSGDFKGTPRLVLEFIHMDYLTPVTNLGEAYLLYSAIDDPATVATCTQLLSPQETLLGQKNFNGIEFTQSEVIGVGAGNIYDLILNRSAVQGVCYEMAFFMHSGNIGNYPPGTVIEFDQASLVGKFEAVLASFEVQ